MKHAVFFSILFTVASNVFAQEIGDIVVVIAATEAKLTLGEKVTQTVPRGNCLVVEDSKDERYFVTWQYTSGWIRKRDVLPLEAALRYFTDAIERDPNAVDYISRGMLWERKGEYDIAIRDYNEAIRRDPTDYDCWYLRGIAWHRKCEFDKAIADYSIATWLDPKGANAYFCRGVAREDKGEFDKAIEDYSEAIRRDPKDVSAYLSRGVVREIQGESDEAIADFDKAIQLDPRNDAAHNLSAWIRATCPDAESRDGDKAVEHARKACELTNWRSLALIDTLAAAYAESGDFESAVKWQRKVLDMTDDETIREECQHRLDLYLAGKPYRDETTFEDYLLNLELESPPEVPLPLPRLASPMPKRAVERYVASE